MIDPKKITNFNLDKRGLEEHLLFWVAVAGKTAATIAPRIEAVLQQAYRQLGHCGPRSPFKIIRGLGFESLRELLRANGIGCHGAKAETMILVATSGLNLRRCTRDDLVAIKGISFKTANCFLMHSRADSRCAAFDTHLLKFMKAMGCSEVSDQPPRTLKQHEYLESQFLNICDSTGFTPADLDLITWRIYAYHKHHADLFIKCMKQRMKRFRYIPA